MSGEIEKFEVLLSKTVKILKSFDFVHSILLFGSRARGISGRDIDICIIPLKELDLRDRLFLESSVPSDIDISLFYELPIHIQYFRLYVVPNENNFCNLFSDYNQSNSRITFVKNVNCYNIQP